MAKKSAGLLLFREVEGQIEVFLVHPGGPLWARKDEGAWSIPKGEFEDGEDPLDAARREFEEETGVRPEVAAAAGAAGGEAPAAPISLGSARQPSGKVVYGWAMRADLDAAEVRSNTFTMEWPPKSGRQRAFPEIDRAGWFSRDVAAKKIVGGQVSLLERLWGVLGGS